MRKLLVVTLAVVGLGLLAAAGVASTPVNFTATSHVAIYSSCRGYPTPRKLPCRVVAVGFQTSKPGGTAVDVDRTTITARRSANAYAYTGTSVLYSDTGTLRSAWTGKYTIRANGTKIDTAHGHITGGTGTVSGIPTPGLRGTFSFTGSNPSGAKLFTYKAHGTLVLP